MTVYVNVKPELIRWARERARRSNVEDLSAVFSELEAWERGEVQPTLEQLQAFAEATHIPFGYLFLSKPPQEGSPIPDLRLKSGNPLSPNLLDTLYAMQRRQDWLREERIVGDRDPLAFVGKARLTDSPEGVGREMRLKGRLGAEIWLSPLDTWQEVILKVCKALETLGVSVVVSDTINGDPTRKLDAGEFRGFTLSDPCAPLVFVNGAERPSAWLLILAHQLAHIWLGQSALSDVGLKPQPLSRIESWCYRAAAEFLVPAEDFRLYWRAVNHAVSPFEALAEKFKVSSAIIARRALDLRVISREAFYATIEAIEAEEQTWVGNVHPVSEQFVLQVLSAVKGGRLTFREANALSGLSPAQLERKMQGDL